jgi:Kef-type K+ transport system membrane component KefB/mannitol/fructose-specific phosphotransferase system IIA component
MDLHPLLTLAIVLSAGLIGGELISRMRLPRVTGWIITGIVLRSLDVPGLEVEKLGAFSPLTDFVLGYIAFSVGSHLDFGRLRNAHKRLVLLIIAEATITPAIVVTAMYMIGGFPIEVAFVFAAIAAAGAPGTTLLVVREARARGVFVKTLVAAVALIDMIAVLLFVIIDTELGTGQPVSGPGFIITALPAALRSLGISAAIGLGTALFVILLTRAVVGPKLLGASLVASILISWGAAQALGVSSILACTFVGMALANLISDKEQAGEAYLANFGDILFTAFYTLAGLRLNFSTVLPMAGLVALFFGSRMLGKVASTATALTLAGAVKSMRNYMGIALLPHGGVAVGLIFFTQSDPNLAAYADTILAVGLAALAINQLVGPSATKFALHKSGEAGRDRPRLLDFLREQDIVTNFHASSREDAIKKLAARLFKTHSVPGKREEFVERAVERDAEESTCMGEGLMIPHAMIDGDAGEMAGVLAISPKGLDFETPDGRPVHAIVLLATPRYDRNRHHEVLAAFAKAIAGDRNIREMLYHCRTAAHAYELLHADEAEAFNYFMHDEMRRAATAQTMPPTPVDELKEANAA